MSKPRKTPESATPHPGTPLPRHSAPRQQAEGSYRDKPAPSPEHLAPLPPEETRRLFHEVREYQIELETQNEELRRVQAELEASQRRYFDLYDLAPVGYCTLSEQGLVLEANLTAATLLGVDRGELVNQPLPCFILKDDQDIHYHHRKQLFETGAPQVCDLRMVKKDGTAFWAHLAATAAQDADGGSVCRVVVSDITDRKRAEEAIEKNSHDLGERIKELNCLYSVSELVRRDGLSQGEILQGCLYVLTQAYAYPEITAVRITWGDHDYRTENFRKTPWSQDHAIKVHGEQAGSIEICYLEERPEEDEGPFLAEERKLLDAVADLLGRATERKRAAESLRQSEEFTRRVVESSNDCIKVLDLQGHLLSMSAGGQKLLEIDELAPYLNRPWADFWRGEDREAALEAISTAKKGDVGTFTGYCETAKGTPKYWEIIISPIRDADGNIERLLAISRDITDRRQAEEALRNQRDFAEGLIETAQAIILVLDTEGRITRINRYMEELSGYSHDEVQGKDWFATFLPAGDWERMRGVLKQAVGNIQTRGNVNPIVTKDGRQREIEWYDKTLKDTDGKTIGVLAIGLDITERKRAVEALRDSEQRFFELFERAPLGYQSLDEQGRFIEVNQTWLETLGYRREEVIGKWFGEFLAPEYVDAFRIRFPQLKAAGKIHSEFQMLRKDGSRRFIAFEGRVGYQPDGSFKQTHCILSDITERRQAEEALRASEEKYRLLFESAGDAIFIIDADARLLAVNPLACERLGYTHAELMSMTIGQVNSPEEARHVPERTARVMKQGQLSCETVHQRKDGSFVPTEVSARRITWYGQPAIMTIARDITERKRTELTLRESESRLRLATSSSNTGLWDWDLRTNEVYYSPIWKSQIGYEDHEIPNRLEEWQSRVHPDDLDRTIAAVRAQIENHRPNYELEFRFRHKDGSYRWILTRAAVLLDEQGKASRMIGSHIDISERKRAEEATNLHAAVTETVTEGIFLIGLDDNIIKWTNRKFETMFGYGPGELVGMHVDKVNAPTEMTPTETRVSIVDLLRQNGEWHGEIRSIKKDGTHFWSQIHVSLFDHPQFGRVMVSAHTDITERKLAEEALRENEERYRTILRTATDGFWLTDMQGHLLGVNGAYCRMSGYCESELLAMRIPDLEAVETSDDTAGHIQKIMAQDEERFESRHRRKDGSVFDVEVSAQYRPIEGGRFVVFLRDITERKQNEETRTRLATAVEHAAEAIVITDPEGTIQYVNPSFERITGYPREEAVGQNPRLLKSGRQSQDFYRKLWDTIKRGETWRGRFTNRRKDGTTYEEECSISPVLGPKGEITNFVASKQDITQDLVMAEQLRQVQKMEVVGQLAAGIAHDFNNLLTVIRGHVDLSKRTLPHEHIVRESLDVIDLASRQASGVTRGLLTFSGRSGTEKEMVNLGTVLRDAGLLLRHLLHAGISLEVNAPAEPPLSLNADPIQLQQVLINLTLNARDAMPKGGRIRIGLSSHTEAGSPTAAPAAGPANVTACIEIRDNGAGMSDEVKAHLFEPFFTTKPRGRGTGLGMSIVRSIVQNHGGRVEVESAPGAGTTVRVFLPGATHTAAAEAAAEAVSRPSMQGEVVLLAEYDRYVAGIIATGLQEQGYQVVRTNDGDELWRQYEERRGSLRLLVLDMDCPGRSVLDCLAAIRATGDPVPVILTTAKNADPPVVLGPHDVLLRKPFHLSEMIRTAVQATAAESPAESPKEGSP